VEQFYRRDSFESQVINRAKEVGEEFGAALRRIDRVRFNKATLFSWLVFVHSTSWKDQELADFIRIFEGIRLGEGNFGAAPEEYAIVRVYSDRASYRVLDVSSVLLRDLVLHTAYEVRRESAGPASEVIPLLGGIYDEEDAERTLLRFIDETGWGASI